MSLGEGFETESLALPHVQGLCPLFTVEDVSSQIPAPAAVLATCCDASFSLLLSLSRSLLCVSIGRRELSASCSDTQACHMSLCLAAQWTPTPWKPEATVSCLL